MSWIRRAGRPGAADAEHRERPAALSFECLPVHPAALMRVSAGWPNEDTGAPDVKLIVSVGTRSYELDPLPDPDAEHHTGWRAAFTAPLNLVESDDVAFALRFGGEDLPLAAPERVHVDKLPQSAKFDSDDDRLAAIAASLARRGDPEDRIRDLAGKLELSRVETRELQRRAEQAAAGRAKAERRASEAEAARLSADEKLRQTEQRIHALLTVQGEAERRAVESEAVRSEAERLLAEAEAGVREAERRAREAAEALQEAGDAEAAAARADERAVAAEHRTGQLEARVAELEGGGMDSERTRLQDVKEAHVAELGRLRVQLESSEPAKLLEALVEAHDWSVEAARRHEQEHLALTGALFEQREGAAGNQHLQLRINAEQAARTAAEAADGRLERAWREARALAPRRAEGAGRELSEPKP